MPLNMLPPIQPALNRRAATLLSRHHLPPHPRATLLLARRRTITGSSAVKEAAAVSPASNFDATTPFFTRSSIQVDGRSSPVEGLDLQATVKPHRNSRSNISTRPKHSGSTAGSSLNSIAQDRVHRMPIRLVSPPPTTAFSFFQSSSSHPQNRTQEHANSRPLALFGEKSDPQGSPKPDGERDPHRLVLDREWELRVGRGILHLRESLPRFFHPSSSSTTGGAVAMGAGLTTAAGSNEEMWPSDVFSKEVKLELPPPLPVKVSFRSGGSSRVCLLGSVVRCLDSWHRRKRMLEAAGAAEL